VPSLCRPTEVGPRNDGSDEKKAGRCGSSCPATSCGGGSEDEKETRVKQKTRSLITHRSTWKERSFGYVAGFCKMAGAARLITTSQSFKFVGIKINAIEAICQTVRLN